MPSGVTVWVLVLFIQGAGMNHLLFTDKTSCQAFLTSYTNELGNPASGACVPANNLLLRRIWSDGD
jgi:hypothetical protein